MILYKMFQTLEEILSILKENNALLKQILLLIQSKYNENDEDDFKDFLMNVIANIVASLLEKDERIMDIIKKRYNL